MGISRMIVPNPQSSTRSKMMMTIKTSTQKKVMRRGTSRRRGLSSERKTSRLFLESGSPMEKPQVMTQVTMNPRRKLWGLPCMMMVMMSHLYLHHPCVLWQEVTLRLAMMTTLLVMKVKKIYLLMKCKTSKMSTKKCVDAELANTQALERAGSQRSEQQR